MDLDKPQRLGEKYRDAKGDDVIDPEFRKTAGLDVVAGDVVEIAPQYDATTNTVHVGTQMLFEILSLMTLNKRW